MPKKKLYFSLPYFGHQSEKLKSEIVSYLSKMYCHTDFKIVLVNPTKIGTLFRYKDRLPAGMLSSVVYEFCCTQGSVPVSYVGSTMRHLSDRVSEHAGRSVRTGKPSSGKIQSNVFDHSCCCQCSVDLSSFKILSSVPSKNEIDLRSLENLYILKKKPNLIDEMTPFPLSIA